MQLTEEEMQAIDKQCISLDFVEDLHGRPDVHRNLDLAEATSDFAGFYKTNFTFVQAANSALPLTARLYEIKPKEDGCVFLDLKLYDSPPTVYRYAKIISSMIGISMFTVHIDGGEAMCREAIRGAEEATKALRRVGKNDFYNQPRPRVIGVTELTTSNFPGYNNSVMRKAELARKWGLDGITAPGTLVEKLVKGFGADWFYIFPGMKFKGVGGEKQMHTYSPEEIARVCTNYLLISGSAVSRSPNPGETAYGILKVIAANSKSTL